MRHLLMFILGLTLCRMLGAADPAELTGGPDGRLHLTVAGDEMFTFSPFAADAGWRFASPTAVPAASPDAPTRFTIKTGDATVSGEVQVSEHGGIADAVWTFTAPGGDIAFNALAISFEASVPALGGGTWEADGQKGTFPKVFGGAPLFSGEVRGLTIAFPDGRSLKLSFPQPTNIGLQDNRQWGGPSFTIRVGKGIGKMAANERYVLPMTIAIPDGLRFRRDLPVTLAANDEWIPLTTELDIIAGSALDLSKCGFTDGPCGGHGRVITTPDGHFAFADSPKIPRRFYGVNLCFSALYLSKERVDQLLDRLIRMGYNTVRIHHYEYRLTVGDWKPGFEWDPAHVDQLDYLMAGCAKRGLWLTTDLYVSRPVSGKQVGIGDDGLSADRFKLLVPVYEPAYQDWATFARKFLDRTNPYTGKRIAEDPVLAWVSLINEGPIAGLWDQAKGVPEWKAAWNRWLAEHFADRGALDLALGDLIDSEDPKAGTVALPDDINLGSRRARACQVFLADTERTMLVRMRHFLRDDLKCPALLTDLNCGGANPLPMQATRAGEFDYVDDHFYVDHPVFLEKQWELPSRCPNSNPIREGAPGGRGSAAMRVWGKPFTVSEFDYSGPGRFRGVGGMLTGALAAFQDWDALWRFAYGHKDESMFVPAPIDYFNLANDPLNLAADRAAVLLYLRRDLKPAPTRLSVVMPPAVLRDPPSKLGLTGIEAFAWTTRVGCEVSDGSAPPTRDTVTVPFSSASDQAAVAALLRARIVSDGSENPIRSETGEIVIDRKRGILTIDTARSAGGYAEAGETIIATNGGVRIDGITTGASVFVCSLENAPIRTAKRLLVTHLTDLQNTGARYGESARQTLLAWGGLPHLVRDGAAKVRITLADPGSFQVWALSTSGRRVVQVPATVEAGSLCFTARVKGSEGACMMYEVTR